MDNRWITPDAVFDGETLRPGLSVRIDGDRVAEIAPRPDGAECISGTISPGFVDLQVNGGGGVLVNAAPDRMAEVVQAHQGFGTAALLATVITDRAEVMERATDAMLFDRPEGVAGLHFEGPHISEAKRGTHRAEHIRPMDDTTFRCAERLRQQGIPVMVTLAPEIVSAADISRLAAMGVVVSLGHSDATAEQARNALRAGARCFTHLFNAMSRMEGRAPGMVGAAITSDVYAGIIADGHHVDLDIVGMAIRARPCPDRMILVSDAMPTVGGPEHFRLYDMEIRVEGGRLVNPEGHLAGAHTTMAEGVGTLVSRVGLPLEQALRMAVTAPARLMGLDRLATIAGRTTRELVRIAPDLMITPLRQIA